MCGWVRWREREREIRGKVCEWVGLGGDYEYCEAVRGGPRGGRENEGAAQKGSVSERGRRR